MFGAHVMKSVPSLAYASLIGFGLLSSVLSACGAKDGRPGSLVSAGGGAGRAGHAGEGGGGGASQAGQATAGSTAAGDEGGEAGEQGVPSTPLAVFPKQLQLDVGCDLSTPGGSLVIQNGGSLPLSITSASADAGYLVKSKLPVSIAPGASSALTLTPPAPQANTALGHMSTGTLSFVTNEPGTPTRHVALTSTLFGAQLEFLDSDGVPLSSGLALTYLSSSFCPDTVKYRVHNTGNVAFTLLGPNFPAHFGGTSAGEKGESVAPDGYVELSVGGNSAPGGVCGGASGVLTFSAMGAFCGAAPTLNVTWPSGTETSCTCLAATK